MTPTTTPTQKGAMPSIFVIFGGGGDLTWRKLMPAIFDLYRDDMLPSRFEIIILDHTDYKLPELKKFYRGGVDQFSPAGKTPADKWKQFTDHLRFLQADFTDPKAYAEVKRICSELDSEWCNQSERVFYLATPPSMFGVIPKFLGEAGLNLPREHSRVVAEKPIGHNLKSARELNGVLTANFDESQIYRIDHYLGKETVQNILAFRFANPLFEPIWNCHYIDYVTIIAEESIGIEHRGTYYDNAGALRDMVQNHLLQLLCLVAMEPMVSFYADEVRNKKMDVLRAIRKIAPKDVKQVAVRGQYGKGQVDGEPRVAYREEESVASDSNTETFAALQLWVDNWRWQGVPFYLRTGKGLGDKCTEIVIHFKAAPHQSFPKETHEDWNSAQIRLGIYPDEEIEMEFQAKVPGIEMKLAPVRMRFDYAEFNVPRRDAYETMILDIMQGDATLFMREDQIEAAWGILEPILQNWGKTKPDFPNYDSGSAGPECADELLARTLKEIGLPS